MNHMRVYCMALPKLGLNQLRTCSGTPEQLSMACPFWFSPHEWLRSFLVGGQPRECFFFSFSRQHKEPTAKLPFPQSLPSCSLSFFFFFKELLPSRELHSCLPRLLLTAAELITPTDLTLKGQTESITPLCFQKMAKRTTRRETHTHSPFLSLSRLLIRIHLTKEGKKSWGLTILLVGWQQNPQKQNKLPEEVG